MIDHVTDAGCVYGIWVLTTAANWGVYSPRGNLISANFYHVGVNEVALIWGGNTWGCQNGILPYC